MTPKERTTALKARLEKVKKKLPRIFWLQIFVDKFPEYDDKRAHLSNVYNGKSSDEEVIERMEKLAPQMKKLTNELLFSNK